MATFRYCTNIYIRIFYFYLTIMDNIASCNNCWSSKNLNEPDWFLNYRLKALKAINELEPPKIERLNYSDWKLWQVPDVHLEVPPKTHNQSFDQEDVLILDFNQSFIEKFVLLTTNYKN